MGWDLSTIFTHTKGMIFVSSPFPQETSSPPSHFWGSGATVQGAIQTVLGRKGEIRILQLVLHLETLGRIQTNVSV